VLDLTDKDSLAGGIEAADTYKREIFAATADWDDYSARVSCAAMATETP
jgi:hypothetical protein